MNATSREIASQGAVWERSLALAGEASNAVPAGLDEVARAARATFC